MEEEKEIDDREKERLDKELYEKLELQEGS
jgi:hypothetical protein